MENIITFTVDHILGIVSALIAFLVLVYYIADWGRRNAKTIEQRVNDQLSNQDEAIKLFAEEVDEIKETINNIKIDYARRSDMTASFGEVKDLIRDGNKNLTERIDLILQGNVDKPKPRKRKSKNVSS